MPKNVSDVSEQYCGLVLPVALHDATVDVLAVTAQIAHRYFSTGTSIREEGMFLMVKKTAGDGKDPLPLFVTLTQLKGLG